MLYWMSKPTKFIKKSFKPSDLMEWQPVCSLAHIQNLNVIIYKSYSVKVPVNITVSRQYVPT